MVKPSMEKLYEECFATYTAKYGPNTAILVNIGSFYSMYDKINKDTGKSMRNVRECAEACGGSPHIEKVEAEWQHVMWGFPENSEAKYEGFLIRAGYTVVMIGQDRDATAKVTGRSLERVSSPGTYIDSSTSTEERRVVSVLVEMFKNRQGKSMWHIASTGFSVSTGECISIETVVPITEGRPNLDAMEAFWSANAPTEVAIWTRDCTLLESQVRPWFTGSFHGPIHIYKAAERSAAATRGALEYLHRIYARDTALKAGTYLDVENYQSAMESLTFLLRWIEDHNPSYLVNLRNHTMWEPGDELILGNAALQQLGMLPVMKPNECLLYWLQKAMTPMGRRALKERCVRPITDVEELNCRQDRIAELRNVEKTGPSLRTHFFNITDLAAVYRKFHRGHGDRDSLLSLLISTKKAIGLDDAMKEVGLSNRMSTEAKRFAVGLLEVWDIERIRACTTDHVIGIGPHHPWARGVHEALDALEDEWTAVLKEVSQIQSQWNILMDEDAISVCWHKDRKEFEWLTTKRRAIALAMLLKQRKKYELEHVAKGSSNAILSSSHLTELSHKARDVWDRWTLLAETLWRDAWVNWEGDYELIDWIAEVDVDAALAKCAEEYGYVRPDYVKSGKAGLSVSGLRHPILERVHTDTPYISHSIQLGCVVDTQATTQANPEIAVAENGILLYGVNAAGKSSLSKAIGLAVLMAQMGMPVPASCMVIAPYNSLYTRILGNDNLWAGMSSFVVEMTELRSILNAGSRALVLGDELCAGTETTSAIAIVSAGIRRLVEKDAHFVFATHLHELLDVPEIAEIPTVKPYHLSVQAPDEGHALIYDRVLREGRGPAIYGLEVCRGLDMDKQFLEYATAIRRKWDGTDVEFSKTSRYNAAVSVQVCNACGSRNALETHHIVPQVAADKNGFVAKGRHMNEKGNLAVLCSSCHDKHHKGEVVVKGWQATTAGRKLNISQFKYKGKV